MLHQLFVYQSWEALSAVVRDLAATVPIEDAEEAAAGVTSNLVDDAVS